MITLNRRMFTAGVFASTIAAASRVSSTVAQPKKDDPSFESAMTGVKIVISDDQWKFFPQLYRTSQEPEFESEYVSITSANATTVEVEFVSGTMTPAEHAERYQALYQENVKEFQLEDSGETEDGPWFVGSFSIGTGSRLSTYFEYQIGAFEKADLIVLLNVQTELFQEHLTALQEGIEIDGDVPLKMLEASSAEQIGGD